MARSSSSADPPREAPAINSNSGPFGTSQSVTASSSGATAAAGAGLSTVIAPIRRPASKPAAVVAWGISNWPTTTSGRNVSTASAATSGRTCSFAPGTTMIRFVPRASTQIGATPDEPGTRRMKVVSMPSEASLSRYAVPWPSSPSVLTMATAAPKRAAITA